MFSGVQGMPQINNNVNIVKCVLLLNILCRVTYIMLSSDMDSQDRGGDRIGFGV